jgi:regulator of sigma E protease
MIELLQSGITIVAFFVILGGLVLAHELGHFVAARLARVRVLEFGIGFPPRARVLGRGRPPVYDRGRPPLPPPALPPGIAPDSDEAERWYRAAAESEALRGGTLYTLNWLPIGGFVRLEGEDGDAADDPRSFARARLPVKLLILVAGVVINLVVSVVIFSGLAVTGDPAIGIRFDEVVAGSPAEAVGLRPGDTLVTLDGRAYSAFGSESMLDDLRARAGQRVVLGVDRASGDFGEIPVTLRVPDPSKDEGALGITQLRGVVTERRISYDLPRAMELGVDRTATAFGLIVRGLADVGRSILTDPTTAPPASGPVGIAVQIGDVLWSLGPLFTLYLVGILSANLALVNILPFPPLDGGRMVVVVLKSVVGERLSLQAERLTYFVGFVLLFAFLIWITAFDILRFGGAVR